MANQRLLHEAMQLHQAGRLAQAETLYKRLLEADPDNADALNLLGTVARQQGRPDAAVDLIRRAIGLRRNVADFHFNLAEACRSIGHFPDAVAAYDKSMQLGGPDPEAYHGMGAALAAAGRDAEAVSPLQRAVQMAPGLVPAYADLAAVLLRLGKPAEAEAACRRALAVQPLDAMAHVALGAVLASRGQLEDSAASYARATQLRPGWSDPHLALASVLDRLGRRRDAESHGRRAVTLAPDSADAHNVLGILLDRQGRLAEGAESYRAAVRLRPDHAEAHGNLANCLKHQGLHAEAIESQRKAIELAPASATLHSNALMLLNYADGVDAGALFTEHRRWSERHVDAVRPFHGAPPEAEGVLRRPLRVGYVSPDFRDHPVRYFMEPVLASHDPTVVTPFVYSDVDRPDAATQKLKALVPEWRDVRGLSDEHLANLIRGDRVDILVDLAGHTAQNRLLAFARVAAPVQVTYLGYPNTTGMPRQRMHYRLTDAAADPPGDADDLHTEDLIRLPDTFLCYRPPDDAPDVAPCPCLSRGHATFGCFNTMEKVTASQLSLWAELLRSLPRSRLVLKNKSLGDAAVCGRVLEAFRDHGVAAERLTLSGPEPLTSAHLARYGEVDIALDTFPYHGTTTTCEAMWMGVPVVTRAGACHRSRVGVSLLSSVIMQGFICETAADYARTALELAGDWPRLQQLRASLRERVRSSPLTNAARFTRALEAAYLRMWQRYRDAEAPALPSPV
jgi:predicted O-linked N-acetylglucosamine transferase (SPINDLY family)